MGELIRGKVAVIVNVASQCGFTGQVRDDNCQDDHYHDDYHHHDEDDDGDDYDDVLRLTPTHWPSTRSLPVQAASGC